MGNPVVHFEIAGPDGPALQQFYRDLFGWRIEQQGEEMGYYGVVWANEGGVGGGIFPTTDDMPVRNFVTVYTQVDDLQAALDKAAGLGGNTTMPPMEIAPEVGAVAMFADPAGNSMGLYALPENWSGEMPPKGDGPAVAHFEIGGSDAEGLESFYTEMFDWQISSVDMGGMAYRFVQQEAEGIGGGIFQHGEGMPPNTPSVGVVVDDLQAYLDKAVGLGGESMMPPTDLPGGFGAIAIFYDIAGNRITLFKSAEEHTHPHD